MLAMSATRVNVEDYRVVAQGALPHAKLRARVSTASSSREVAPLLLNDGDVVEQPKTKDISS
jgi:hypothetical protein